MKPDVHPADVLLGWSDQGCEEMDQSVCRLPEASSYQTIRATRPVLPGLWL